jgi:hypothetical protein
MMADMGRVYGGYTITFYSLFHSTGWRLSTENWPLPTAALGRKSSHSAAGTVA